METKNEAKRRIEAAMRKVEQAQNLLNEACSDISNTEGGGAGKRWSALGKVADKVKGEWYRLNDLRHSGRVDLDGIAKEALKRRQPVPLEVVPDARCQVWDPDQLLHCELEDGHSDAHQWPPRPTAAEVEAFKLGGDEATVSVLEYAKRVRVDAPAARQLLTTAAAEVAHAR